MERNYYYGMWFVGNHEADWFAKLFKRDGKWILAYRFRYYDGKKPGAFNDDSKNNYAFSTKDDSPEELARMLGTIANLQPLMQFRFGSEVDFVKIECFNDEPQFFDAIAGKSWIHIKIEEANAN